MKTLLLILLSSILVFGQEKTIYYNINWVKCQSNEAMFYRKYILDENQQIVGSVKDYYADGVLYRTSYLKTIDEFSAEKDFIVGKRTTYYCNGEVKQKENYVNNIKNGLNIYLYENGNVESMVEYKMGVLDGKSTEYYNNKVLKSEKFYAENKLHGEYILYDTDGRKESILIYENGVAINKKSFDTSGNEIPFVDKTKEVFLIVETMPEFPGGISEFQRYLASNLKFPKIPAIYGIGGRVIVTFVINEIGKVTNPIILKSVNCDIDKEALRVVSECPDWRPGKQNGKNASVKFTLPIKFDIK